MKTIDLDIQNNFNIKSANEIDSIYDEQKEIEKIHIKI